MSSALAVIAAVASALLAYLASPHCRIVHTMARRRLRVLALACAVIASAVAIPALGIGAGLCLVLGAWMLSAVATPYLGLLHRVPTERG
jgi:hypothetical protein